MQRISPALLRQMANQCRFVCRIAAMAEIIGDMFVLQEVELLGQFREHI
ncbi:MAG: hypothetical protein M0D54_21115 [Hyphomonadaceae bacterium JAD_PAG50586_4]|nr:MAG: hypothetical protein M0D54_21115 [Hyphomonadaceae bacterium JAD_PAG50586_4]